MFPHVSLAKQLYLIVVSWREKVTLIQKNNLTQKPQSVGAKKCSDVIHNKVRTRNL